MNLSRRPLSYMRLAMSLRLANPRQGGPSEQNVGHGQLEGWGATAVWGKPTAVGGQPTAVGGLPTAV